MNLCAFLGSVQRFAQCCRATIRCVLEHRVSRLKEIISPRVILRDYMSTVRTATIRICRHVRLRRIASPASYRYFSQSCLRLRDEIREVPVGGNGFIKLNFIKPTQRSSRQDCLIYLPPGPFPKQCSPSWPSITASELARALPTTTVVEVQYRLAHRDFSTEIDHRFPTPVHDVFAAFDYITEALQVHASSGRVEPSKMTIYGSHIGGGLAITLALTNPSQIQGVVVENPMVDWPILEEIAKFSSSKKKKSDTSRKNVHLEAAKALMTLRNGLFRTPSTYFDSFASPVLFLRAPGRDTPLTNVTADASSDQAFFQGSPIRYGDEDDEVGLVEYEDQAYGPYDDEWHAADTTKERNQYYRIEEKDGETKDALHDIQDGENSILSKRGSSTAEQLPAYPRRRKVLQRWPPNAYAEDALLPFVNIFSGSSAATGDESIDDAVDVSPVIMMQATELADLLRRACFWDRERSFAEERVTLTTFDESSDVAGRRVALLEYLTKMMS